MPRLLVLQPARASDVWLLFASVFVVCVFARRLETSRLDARVGTVLLMVAIGVWVTAHGAIEMIVLLLLALVWRSVPAPRAESPRRLAPLVVAFVFAGALLALGLRAKERGSLRAALGSRPPAEQVRLGEWAQRSTAREAVFLIDPEWDEFRPLARRPIYTTWKDGAAVLWASGRAACRPSASSRSRRCRRARRASASHAGSRS